MDMWIYYDGKWPPWYHLSSHKLESHLAALREFEQSVEAFFLSFFFFLLWTYNIVSVLTIKLKGKKKKEGISTSLV